MAASGTEAQIDRALLLQVAALTFSPAIAVRWSDGTTTNETQLPCAMPDVAFPGIYPQGDAKEGQAKPKPDTYLDIKIFPAPTQPVALADRGVNGHVGFLQLTIVTPIGRGAISAAEIAAQIIAQFKRGTKLTDGNTTVRITRPGYKMPSFRDGEATKTPVTIRYEASGSQG